ncbi:MAG: hypothetical protein JWN61_262 [Pseudonocardiales bacterium]|nr:hypothetical protein [Pseudonocardiales bacterium]
MSAVSDAPPSPARGTRSGRALLAQLVAACVAAAATGALAVSAVEPVAALTVVAVLQGALIAAITLGSRLPGRYGASILLIGGAVAADMALAVWTASSLDPLLNVLALVIPALFAHQLVRGTGRTALVTSLSGLAAAALAIVCLGSWAQLAREDGGKLLCFGAAIAVGAAMATAMVVDGVGLGPRIDIDSAPTVAGLVVGTVLGAAAGGAVLGSGESMGMVAGVAVGTALSIIAVLLGLGSTMLVRAAAISGLGAAARPILLVIPVLAGTGPIAYVLCLAVQG